MAVHRSTEIKFEGWGHSGIAETNRKQSCWVGIGVGRGFGCEGGWGAHYTTGVPAGGLLAGPQSLVGGTAEVMRACGKAYESVCCSWGSAP